jgi:hypothetical protein
MLLLRAKQGTIPLKLSYALFKDQVGYAKLRFLHQYLI